MGNTDAKYKNIDSGILLTEICKLLREKNFSIVNVDSIIVAQKPKLAPYIFNIRCRLSEIMELEIDAVSVKAKTEEGLGFTGTEQGIAAYAVAAVER